MITNILLAFLVIGGIGILLGFGLAFSSKKLAVEKSESFLALEAIMPGANCGMCGFAGCSAYAEAIANGEAEIGLCPPGGENLAKAMSQIMGVVTNPEFTKMVAFVHCNGTPEVTKKSFEYEGMYDCNAASTLFKGDNACKAGCLHMGSCIAVCPVEAITRDSGGNVYVKAELCIGCMKCTKVCPNGIIRMIPATASHVVACNNHDPGGVVRKICSAGCISCKICENKYPESGCRIVNNLSIIDYSLPSTQIAEAAQACPVQCIVPTGIPEYRLNRKRDT